MTIAKTVADFLRKNHVSYSVVHHPRTHSTTETANAAHVPADRLAKAVVLMDGRGYLMGVIPGNRHVSIDTLSRKLGRHFVLAAEPWLAPIFKDCDLGAIPPIGPAYGVETILDDSLVGQPEVYFEAGDHQDLVRVDGERFLSLLKEARHGQFSH